MNILRVVSDKMYPYSNIEPIPKGQIEFSKIRFILSDDWDDRRIIVQFVQGETPLNRGLENGSCFVPSELQIGEVMVYLKGYSISGESLATVNGVTIPIVQGGVDGGEPSVPPGPDLYQLLLKELNESEANAKDYSNKAVEAAGKAETAAIRQPYPNEETGTWWVWDAETGAYTDTGISYGTGAGGVTEHERLSGRDKANQHPMSAITGLEDALAGKQPTGNYLTSEQDPTVPKWAKQPQKPAYTAQEVGALPDTTYIPSTADDVNAEPAGAVSQHNVSDAAHSDIRLLIQGLSERLSAVADSDDTTLDQLSEVVSYIKSNRDLIAAVTTDKVGVTDIVNDLVTNVANKPLSAAQGVALKAMIDAITIPTALPNPNAMTFTGAVTGRYDGSAPLEVEIPSGGGGGNPLYVKGGTTLAEGTIPSGLAQYTFTDTGLKLYEVLQEWKIFFIQVYCAGEVNNINISTYQNNSQPFYNPGKDCNYALSIFEGVTKDSVKFMFFSAGVGNYWDVYSPIGAISSYNMNPAPTLSIKHIPPDTGLYLRNYGKDTGHDYLWKVTGLVKWG